MQRRIIMHTQQTYSEPDELRARFTRWLEVLVYRARNKYLQKEANRVKTISLEDLHEDQLPTFPAPAYEQNEFVFENECLGAAFSSLSPESQRLLSLMFKDGMTPRDISQLLDCKIKDLYNGKYLAIRKLRTILAEDEGVNHEKK